MIINHTRIHPSIPMEKKNKKTKNNNETLNTNQHQLTTDH